MSPKPRPKIKRYPKPGSKGYGAFIKKEANAFGQLGAKRRGKPQRKAFL